LKIRGWFTRRAVSSLRRYKFHLAIVFAGGARRTLGGERRGASIDIEGRCVFEAIELGRVIIVAVRNSQSKKQPQRRDRAWSESTGSLEHSLIISLWGYRRRRRRWERRSWSCCSCSIRSWWIVIILSGAEHCRSRGSFHASQHFSSWRVELNILGYSSRGVCLMQYSPIATTRE